MAVSQILKKRIEHFLTLTFKMLSLMVFLAIPLSVKSQTGISTINVTTTTGTNTNYVVFPPSDAINDIGDIFLSGLSIDVRNGRGNNVLVSSYVVGGTTYDNFLTPDTVAIRRTDGSRFINIWYTLQTDPDDGNVTTLDLDPDAIPDADLIYQTRNINAGYDNVLVNDDDEGVGAIQAQTERVDIIWRTGIVTCEPDNAVFPVVDRGGNDEVKIAAITALDANGDPSSYSTLVSIEDADWPGAGQSYDNFLILRREAVGQNPLPIANIGTFRPGQSAQIVQGVAVSFTELGIAANEVVYGYSIFASDVNTGSHTLTDITTFPTDTKASDSGLDLVAGVTAAVSSDNCLTPATGPGGFKAALATWLKANESADVTTSTEASTVTDWQDHWTGDHDFTTGAAAPTYRSTSSTINFNPTVDFTSSATSLTTADNSDFNTATSYANKGINIAFRTSTADVTDRQVLYEQGDNTRGITIYIRNGDLHVSSWNRNNDGAGSPWNNGTNITTISASVATNTEYIVTLELDGNSSSSGTLTAYLNGQTMGTLASVGLLFNHSAAGIEFGGSDGNSQFDDGTNSSTNSFEGEISELIYCNEPTNFALSQRNRIESYLAVKYGITLNQSTAINYVNSAGNIIFDATNNASIGGYLEYNNDIAGIGRDDGSELEQQKSRSENANSVITIDHGGSFTSDNSYLLWGNDGAAVTNTETMDVPALINERIVREWRVAETGSTGNNSISFDLSELTITGSKSASDYSLLVAGNSSNGDFSTATVITGGMIVGSTLTFSNVDLANGEYFTLGTGFITCGPGGVTTDLSLWFRSNLGTNTTTNGAVVSSWADQAGSNDAAASNDGGGSPQEPTYATSGINFNPSITFTDPGNTNNAWLRTSSLPATGDMTLATVYNTTQTDASGFGEHWDTPIFISTDEGNINAPTYTLGQSAGRVHGKFTSTDEYGARSTGAFNDGIGHMLLATRVQSAAANSVELYLDSDNVASDNSVAVALSDGVGLGIGNHYAPFDQTSQYAGGISEVIAFTDDLTSGERQRVESYLGIKYGITIDQSTGQDYVNSSGTGIWVTADNSAYNDDIAGIGRDDNSCLEQRQSKSVNSDAIVTIGLGGISSTNAENSNAFTANNSFLLWGNDNAAREFASRTTGVTGIGTVTERMTRIWKVDESGTVGNTSVSFDLTGLGYSSLASDFQLIIADNSGLTSATTISGGTFNGNVLTFDNIDFADGDFFTLGTARSTCGPGGITTNLALWLKADAGTGSTTDAAEVDTWSDQSSNARNASETNLGGSGPINPTFESSEINFNPAIQINDPGSTNGGFMTTTGGNNVSGNMSLITVFETGQTGGSTTDFEQAPTFIGAGENTTTTDYGLGIAEGRVHFNAADNSTLNARSPSGTTYNDLQPHILTGTRAQSAAAGSIQLYVNSANVASGTSTNTALSSPTVFGIGNLGTTAGSDATVAAQLNGRIAEAIVFSQELSSGDRQQVESYLAIKYGITRAGGTGEEDYLASDAGVVWDWSADTNYNSDIAGIARDDGSCFNQLKSKSENSDALVTMEAGSFSTDDSFLIWGNDNTSIEDTNNREFNSSQVRSRLNREWRVQETGTIGNITLTYDLSAITGPTGIGTNNLNLVRLLTDADGDFTSGVTLTSPTSIDASAKTISFTVDFTTGQYFTLGSEEIAALPVELIAFDAEVVQEEVELTWTTASEVNNAYYNIERSKDGISFNTIGQLDGRGNTIGSVNYKFIDSNPIEGYSFYRLKQNDINGEFDYSPIKSVLFEKVSLSELSLMPNPLQSERELTLKYTGNLNNQDCHISIMSSNGKVLLDRKITLIKGHLTIKLPNLSQGIYLISLQTEKGEKFTKRLIAN